MRLQSILIFLIENGAVNFIFGDHSSFDDLCYDIVTKLKESYSINRIHFRKDYKDADAYTMQYLTSGYEESICFESFGRSGYITRNRAMISESEICVFYYDENYLPSIGRKKRRDIRDRLPKSGTALAYRFAKSKNKIIINCFDNSVCVL